MSDQRLSVDPRPAIPFAEIVERAVLAVCRRWLAVLILYGSVVIALAIAAPLFKAAGLTALSVPIYFAYAFICHQHADRSLHINGEQMAFCIRDFAIFGGAVGVALAYAIARRHGSITPPGWWLIALAVVPIGLDGFSQLAGLRDSNTVLRIATGLTFSIVLGWYLLPRLESGFRTVSEDIEARESVA